jgi:hypothetical protein
VLGRSSILVLSCATVLLLLAGSGGGATEERAVLFPSPPLLAPVPDASADLNPHAVTTDVWQSFAVPAGIPEVRLFGLASDPVDRTLVLFGGCGGGVCSFGSNTTWVESDGVWRALHPTVSPPAREGALMAWDPVDRYVLLFGGDQNGNPLNDTWAFKNGTWNRVIPSGPSPPPSQGGALAYDPSDHVMVLYGGGACQSHCPTWTYAGGAWSQLDLVPLPATRSGEAFAEDDPDDGALLYGGYNTTEGTLSDTWLFSHDAWTPVNLTAPAPVVNQPLAAWDPSLGVVVLSGSNGTWEYTRGSWVLLAPTAPVGVAESSLGWDPTTGVLVEVSGCTAGTCPSVSLAGFGPPHEVGMEAHGSPCGSFLVEGIGVDSGGATALENGTYSLSITACHGYLLANLSAAPPLTVNASNENLTTWNGTVFVSGSGNVSVNFTRVASNPPPTGLAAISVLGLTFLDLLLVIVALVGGVVCFLVLSRRPSRPPKRRPPRTGRTPPGF